jgi:hypothetical protein
MSKLRLVLAASITASAILTLTAEPAHAVIVANQMVQVYSCAINVRGGACYAWYRYPYNGYYNPAVPSVVVLNRFVYNRYQF